MSALIWFSSPVERVRAAGLPPAEALRRMKVADGFTVKLYANEPKIRQPLTMSFDERGRMWVIQYLQYPTPAGLKAVQVDQYLRTKYDQLPEPPPRGPKGADRITICEDTDGDGRADKFTDFVTGLNLASGLALGYGGVFVAQPPYLLFYPDRNHDDVPDGDPEVLLTGFGMEDAHAFANSLIWGPDGWLYGAHGSTVTANIRGLEFQQGIWRYHPLTKEFELFAEGGGNTWGLDFDEDGNIIAGTNYGDTVGLHQVQGAYYVKGFSKHGPLHNPYTFGYFEHLPFKGFKGGHVTAGGIMYQGGSFPAQFNNRYIAANLLANAIYWHVLEPQGSSFIGHFGGELLTTDDHSFRPIDCTIGPDGSVFVADWYDQRATHVDPQDNWDRDTGRIYKIEANGTRPVSKFDLTKLSSTELVKLLANPNDWYVREARCLLSERRDAKIISTIRKNIFTNKNDRLALQSLWALYVSGGFNDALAIKLLDHPNKNLRAWTVRLLGDARTISPSIEKRLIALARTEPSPTVRNQLACSAKRLSGEQALPLVQELLRRGEDVDDPQIPLLLWWAVEDKAISNRAEVLKLFADATNWKQPLVHQFIVERVAQRYAAEADENGYAACAQLLDLAPDETKVTLLLQGMEKALEGRGLSEPPPALEKSLARLWRQGAPSLALVRFALRLGYEAAKTRALAIVADPKASGHDRAGLIEMLGQSGHADCVPMLENLLSGSESKTIRSAALAALQRFNDPQIPEKVLELYPQLPSDLRQGARGLLCSRPTWALAFLNAVEAGRVAAKDVPVDQVRQIALHRDARLNQLVEKLWGKIQPESEGVKRARVGGIISILGQAKGDPVKGRELFLKTCAVCHKLFGEGNNIGPELTGADRKNRDFLLTNIVDPSAYIRAEFVSYNVEMKDGRALNGLMAESTPTTVTLLDANNQRTVLNRAEIKELKASSVSLMPEGLLDTLEPQQIRDLISYVQSDGTK
ncbi:MAG: c-type cytochrome [Verrucomicrobia bacterium]|nr:c-type cytochrome [Verrucomicrobiota bacterium]